MDQVRRLWSILPLASAMLAFALVGACSLAWYRRRRGLLLPQALERSVQDAALISWLVVVVVLLLGPAHTPPGRRLDLVPFRELHADGFDRGNATIEMIGNLFIFMPLGFLAALGFSTLRSFPRVLALGFVLSLLLEGLQFALPTGREASVTDIVLNGLGAALRYGVFRVALGRRQRAMERRVISPDSGTTSHRT